MRDPAGRHALGDPPAPAPGAEGPWLLPGDPDAIVGCFEKLPTAVFVHEGPEHTFVAVNRAARAILGDRPVLGRSFRVAMPDLEGQRMLALMDEAYRSGQPAYGREWRLLLATGEGGELTERIVDFSIVPHHHADGTIRGVFGHTTDLTAEVHARDAARVHAERRYEAAQSVVMALQGSLLPESLPVLPGVQVAAHYLVAATEQAAGGDWFDAVALPGGRIALVVGDVVGHGARASAVMGQLRAVLNAFLLEGYGVTETLARLDRFVARTPAAAATTVCLAMLDPATGELAYACCGHPPPLLITAGGETRYLPGRHGAPLGTAGPAPPALKAVLDPGDVVMLYTDGLVERPGRGLADGLAELQVYAADAMLHGSPDMMAGAAVDRVCRISLERMTRQGHSDDVSLIAAQLVGRAPEAFSVELPAVAAELPGLRRDVQRWLATLGASDRDVAAVQIAVGEAAANVIEHAYPDGAGTLLVEGYHDPDGRACLTVLDHGRWRPPPAEPNLRGRGLLMVRGCMDTVEIDTGPGGTSVLLDRRLSRPPVLVTGVPTSTARPGPAPVPAAEFAVRVTRSDPPTVTVSGQVDMTTAAELRVRLMVAGQGGALPLDVDLSAVTHLASAGVQALHELAEQMGADGRLLRLLVAEGSPVADVLALTGLDHLAHPDGAG